MAQAEFAKVDFPTMPPVSQLVPGEARRLQGRELEVQVRRFAASDTLRTPATERKCEEVGAILEGVFVIEAWGERYQLTPGEGILIPPGTDRIWTCLEDGLLYRVLTEGAPTDQTP